MYYVYLLRSINFSKQTYIGHTDNLQERLETHNSGGSIHTAQYRPWELITSISFNNLNQAIAFEKYLKSGSGRAFSKKRLCYIFFGNTMKVSITYKDKEKDKVHVSVTYDDLWNGDVTLARVIYPFLKKYRNMYDKRKWYQGCPMDFAPDPTKPEGPDNPDRFDEWLQCLDTMIYSFEWIAKNHGWDGPTQKEYYKECSRLRKAHKKELKKLAQEDKERFKDIKGPSTLESLEWNRHSEIMRPTFEIFHKKFEEHRQKLQEGINLFAKYFGSFWL